MVEFSNYVLKSERERKIEEMYEEKKKRIAKSVALQNAVNLVIAEMSIRQVVISNYVEKVIEVAKKLEKYLSE
ncbi:MAG: hypothetical protein QXL14_00445 [Candidatus Aenigmatarchaeota archaeon]